MSGRGTHAASVHAPRSHRGPSDRYARGVLHGAFIGTGMCVLFMALAIIALLV
ncbi:hypothetical protein [Actinomadura sp. WMMB 499]|uniref:hypothetical protein n=1 Tax=Actinomadura sp. WMMB 499 TaxID=1219491 RepID=UPI00159DF3F3|nr:hypothetical protein [Actinomadura sp. WMMB 499]